MSDTIVGGSVQTISENGASVDEPGENGSRRENTPSYGILQCALGGSKYRPYFKSDTQSKMKGAGGHDAGGTNIPYTYRQTVCNGNNTCSDDLNTGSKLCDSIIPNQVFNVNVPNFRINGSVNNEMWHKGGNSHSFEGNQVGHKKVPIFDGKTRIFYSI